MTDGASGAGRARRRAAVLGSPIAHSLSPVLHRAAYAALGLDWRYDRIEVDVAGLAGFLAGLDDSWVGLSLTMPLKHAVLPLCEQLSPLAANVGAINTVLFGPDRARTGHNTDVPGLVAALRAAGLTARPDRVAVLGGGATATSALAAVAGLAGPEPAGPRRGGPVEVYVRDPARAAAVVAVAANVGVVAEIRPWRELADGLGAGLVISTVPAAGSVGIATAVPDRVRGLLFDVVYDPWPTPLAIAWRQAGGEPVGGLGLLVRQAALQVELMTGRAGIAADLVPVMAAAVAGTA